MSTTGPITGGYALPNDRRSVVHKNNTGTDWKQNASESDTKCPIAEALAAAIERYTERVLKGLGALTEDEIAERIAEFKYLYEPCAETATPEELAAFSEKLLDFIAGLRAIAANQDVESLLTIGDDEGQKNQLHTISNMIRQRIVSQS